jgi:hypothetical protein
MNPERNGLEGMDWIQLAQDMVQRWTLVNTDMHLWIP